MITNKHAQILSVGTAVPEKIMYNRDFESILDTSDEWITTRTGIKQRHIVPENKSIQASDLGAEAAQKALQRADIDPEKIDGILCATFTPDAFFPSTACGIQYRLGCKNAFALDVSAACAGFVYALVLANGMIRSKQARTLIVVGAEIISKVLDWTDRTTCILFGDGAGAVILQENDTLEECGILSTYLGSDGSLGDILELPAWGKRRMMRMNGNEVFKQAVRMMSEASLKTINKAGLTTDEIDLLIPHQANIRIMKALSSQIGIPFEKVVTNVDRYGNTSSASIPLALEEPWMEGRIKPGMNVLLTSVGGGVTVASALVRF